MLDLILGELRPFCPHDEGDRDFTGEIILHSERRDQRDVRIQSKKLAAAHSGGLAPSGLVIISINNDLRYDGGVLDLRVRDEEGLKLRRRYLEPLVLDDLLEPVDDEDLVVVVNVADVPGVQPAVLVDGVLRGLGVVQVT